MEGGAWAPGGAVATTAGVPAHPPPGQHAEVADGRGGARRGRGWQGNGAPRRQSHGGMAERLKAAVLKTAIPLVGVVGSNPTPSATCRRPRDDSDTPPGRAGCRSLPRLPAPRGGADIGRRGARPRVNRRNVFGREPEAALRLLREGASKERRRRALEALDLVGLRAWAGCHPNDLSGGMRHRVGLARALATDPATPLMDDVAAFTRDVDRGGGGGPLPSGPSPLHLRGPGDMAIRRHAQEWVNQNRATCDGRVQKALEAAG